MTILFEYSLRYDIYNYIFISKSTPLKQKIFWKTMEASVVWWQRIKWATKSIIVSCHDFKEQEEAYTT